MKRLVIALVLASCGDDAAAPEGPTTAPVVAPSDAIAKTTENGPVKATVKVWPPKPVLGEPIYVRLEVDAPVGVSIDAPFQEAGDQKLGRFRVLGFTRDAEHTPAGGQLQQQTYTLEAQTSGHHRVPPLRLEMIDARTGSDAHPKPQEILTDEIPLDIGPVPTAAATAELKPAYGPLETEVGGTSWVVVLGILSGIAVVGSGSVLLYRAMKQKQRIAQQRSAYEEAVARLDALAKRGAPDAESADGWFVDLSAALREYVEQRYYVRAPELTTEEFLQVATARPELDDQHRELLSEFLERCDRVKFAGYRPDAAESLATLETARKFVEDTRLRMQEAA